jgi:hypothetical protein
VGWELVAAAGEVVADIVGIAVVAVVDIPGRAELVFGTAVEVDDERVAAASEGVLGSVAGVVPEAAAGAAAPAAYNGVLSVVLQESWG